MKAGTTWLYDLLLRHPELHFTLEKELHYFYDRDVWARSRDVLRLPRQLSKAHRMRKVRERYLNRIDPDHDSPDEIRAKRDWIAGYLKHPVDDAWYWNLFAQRPEGAWACDFSNLYARLSARNWRRIAALYDVLARAAPGPIVEVNRAVAHGRAFGPEVGLAVARRLHPHGRQASVIWCRAGPRPGGDQRTGWAACENSRHSN